MALDVILLLLFADSHVTYMQPGKRRCLSMALDVILLVLFADSHVTYMQPGKRRCLSMALDVILLVLFADSHVTYMQSGKSRCWIRTHEYMGGKTYLILKPLARQSQLVVCSLICL